MDQPARGATPDPDTHLSHRCLTPADTYRRWPHGDGVTARSRDRPPRRHRSRSRGRTTPSVDREGSRYRLAVAYDEGLAERLRDLVSDDSSMSERKMFGGLAFLCGGNMAFGIVGDELMVRVGPDDWTDALGQPHAREMDFTGRSMKGLVYVGVAGFAEDDDLQDWVARGVAYARSLPPK